MKLNLDNNLHLDPSQYTAEEIEALDDAFQSRLAIRSKVDLAIWFDDLGHLLERLGIVISCPD